MAGTKAGAKKATAKMYRLYGEDYFRKIGRIGGRTITNKPKGFAVDKRSNWDKLRGVPKHAVLAGAKGGTISRRRVTNV